MRTNTLPEYKSPQNETPTGRLLLIFLATFIVLILFQPLLKKYGPQPQTPQQEQQQQKTQPAAPQPSAALPAPAEKKSKTVQSAVPVNLKQATAETESVIDSNLYKITFTNRGGQVKSWILKGYNDDKGQPLDLVLHPASEKYGYPLSLFTYDQNLRNKLNSVLYTVKQTGRDITFEYADADTTVRKTFRFDDSYIAKIDVEVTEHGQRVDAYPAWPAGFGDSTTPASYGIQRVDFYPVTPISHTWYGGRKDVERLTIKDVSGGATITNPFYWAGVSNQYFGAIFCPTIPKAPRSSPLAIRCWFRRIRRIRIRTKPPRLTFSALPSAIPMDTPSSACLPDRRTCKLCRAHTRPL